MPSATGRIRARRLFFFGSRSINEVSNMIHLQRSRNLFFLPPPRSEEFRAAGSVQERSLPELDTRGRQKVPGHLRFSSELCENKTKRLGRRALDGGSDRAGRRRRRRVTGRRQALEDHLGAPSG